MQTERFDDIVLGGGKGGKSLAMALGPSGRKVALVESKMVGGSCINVACIPTKTMVASAKLLHNAEHAIEFGLDVHVKPESALTGIIGRKRRVVKQMVDTHLKLFQSTPNMEFIAGKGRFIGPKTIEVLTNDGGTRWLEGERIVINTGSKTLVPNTPGLEETGYLTSTSIMELETLPKHLLIIGGGYIALEFAQIFRRLGSKVTVLQRSTRFLPKEDEDVAQSVLQVLQGEGIEFHFEAAVESVKRKHRHTVEVGLTIASQPHKIEASDLMVAVGRASNNDGLNLEAAGVDLDSRGYIKVNDKLETSARDIYALGDCNGGPHFTHVSWDDYRILLANLRDNGDRRTTGRLIPYTLFVDPELGRVGLTEEEARTKGLDIRVARLQAAKVPRANTAGETRGMLKAIIDRASGKILGCSIFAHEGGEIMSVLQMAMLGGLTYTTLRDTIFTHPTMAESLNLLFAAVED